MYFLLYIVLKLISIKDKWFIKRGIIKLLLEEITNNNDKEEILYIWKEGSLSLSSFILYKINVKTISFFKLINEKNNFILFEQW